MLTIPLRFRLAALEIAGSPGSVTDTSIESRDMDATNKQSYPLALLRLMRRHAEDLLWADNLNEGRQVLRFIKAVTSERTDARDFFKGKILQTFYSLPLLFHYYVISPYKSREREKYESVLPLRGSEKYYATRKISARIIC